MIGIRLSLEEQDIEVAARAYKIAAIIIFGAFAGEPQ